MESKTVAPATKTTIQVTVGSLPDPGIASLQGEFRYDPKVLTVTDVQFPQMLGGSNVIAVNRQTAGLVRFAATLYGANLKGIKSGVLLEFAVEAVGKPGDKSDLTLSLDVLSDVNYNLLTAEITNGIFEIREEQPPPNQPPVADFSFTPAQPAAGQTVQFTDKSTDPDGRVVAWAWDFGDGTKSNQQNPTHVYQTAGTFEVRLIVTDDKGAQSSAVRKTITVGPPTELKVEIINFPNPAKDRTRFRYGWLLPGPAQEATLKIFNLKGELVFSQSLDITKSEFAYNLNDSDGRPLPNGPYFYFLTVIAQDGRSFRSPVNVLAIQR
ncbi:MAG: PKD domain-containing protein [Candidatus Bipolaricaulota bacterium]|nr:PKD domain-containing protein [Candidatus Bipolaricaulota bacterium]MCS7273793.1 PKD domain-containing protein [Candidatus Bipolaricaulota bacterium]MDW8111134.1 PKD domain-containing protein [Candidatus Bipolaricaulota bacterium]MDW8329752.1 PKD domain-containing protein [Candidatus Bipolaricaulota bacterium]